MLRISDLLMMLYPAEYRAKFGDEMRAVFMALANSRTPGWWFLCNEYRGLLQGAVEARCRPFVQLAPSIAGGAVFASGMQFLVYWCLLPGKGRSLARVLEQLVSRVLVICALVGIAAGQPAKQDAATLELARSIYGSSFTALREAKTMEDMRKLSDHLDAPEWISVDRFGRTILAKQDADRDLESLLALPPERRVTGMDILWAEQDSERLIVVGWMMVNVAERIDARGEFGPKGASHKLTRGTLIRDVFVNTADGWRRIRHDKLVPNDMVLAVDGVARIVPPLDPEHRAAPER
jgi:hypothetical protein